MRDFKQPTCKNGHELDESTLVYVPATKQWNCRRCHRLHSAKSHQKKVRSGSDWRYKLKKYGLTEASFAEMLAAQGGRCSICSREIRRPWKVVPGRGEAGGTRLQVTADSIAIDHRHETGEVRGLLCLMCNRGLGDFGNDAARLRRAANYLDGSGNG